MAHMPLKCPHCESRDVGRFGASAVGKQRYICRNKDCRKPPWNRNGLRNGCENGRDAELRPRQVAAALPEFAFRRPASCEREGCGGDACAPSARA